MGGFVQEWVDLGWNGREMCGFLIGMGRKWVVLYMNGWFCTGMGGKWVVLYMNGWFCT